MDDKAKLLAALEAMLSEIEDAVDVVDGRDGEPRPNWAMRLMEEHGKKVWYLARKELAPR